MRASHEKKNPICRPKKTFFLRADSPKEKEKTCKWITERGGGVGEVRRNGSSYSDFFRTGIRGETQEGSGTGSHKFYAG